MLACNTQNSWTDFLEHIRKKCSSTAFNNWFLSIKVVETKNGEIVLEIPNIFVQEYILNNYTDELKAFLPVRADGTPAISFVVSAPRRGIIKTTQSNAPAPTAKFSHKKSLYEIHLNDRFHFSTFIEGPENQFVKSAAMGIAARPGHTYNPLFIHGGVGLGKTHLLHSIGHDIRKKHPQLRVQCISTEGFVNAFVDALRNKSINDLKRSYRSSIDVLLIDDIQFLQNRSFETEVCNTLEALMHQKKQIVVTSDKPPGELKFSSERMKQRLEWGLVAQMSMPELETRVAILLQKAEEKGLPIPHEIAIKIGEKISKNIRQLEGAINRLSAHCRLLGVELSEDMVDQVLGEMLEQSIPERVTVEQILKSVSAVFEIPISELKGPSRAKSISLPRQVAMYLAKTMTSDSLSSLAEYFRRKTHSTILHAVQSIKEKALSDEVLRRKIDMVKRHLGHR